MKLGADYLGGHNFRKAMLRAHPQGWAGGIFLDTFGYALTTVEAMCASGKFSEIVVQMARFDNSHKYPIRTLMPFIEREARKLEAISQKYPKTVLMLSPFCEHNHAESAIVPVLNRIKQLAPSCLPVNSIWQGQPARGFITEIHLPNGRNLPRPPSGEFTISADGYGGDGTGDWCDADIPAILQRYSKARHVRWWNFRMNGKFGHKDTAAVNARKHWPGEKYLRGHHAQMDNREGTVTWPTNALMKPFSDDHGQPEPTKDNKLMCILPVRMNKVDVLDSRGTVIDVMNIPRPPLDPNHSGEPKGYRFYSTKYAYEVGNIAQKNTGSRLVQIRAGSKMFPLTDVDLRSGRFR